MCLVVLATSSLACDFGKLDLDICGYRDLSKAGSHWVQTRDSGESLFGCMCCYLRTTHAHNRKIIVAMMINV